MVLPFISIASTASFALTQQCPTSSFVGSEIFGRIGPSLATLLLLSSKASKSNGLISNISVGPSQQFYFALSPFESILLGLILLKIMLFRYLDMLPIDINRLVAGDLFGGRRKRSIDPQIVKEKERLAETMFTVIRRLDMQDCLLRTLCELQVHSLQGSKLPRETKLTLSALSKSGWNRKQNEKPNPNPDVIEDRPVLSVFEEAVHVAWAAKNLNGTECQDKYFICPLTKQDIFSHFDTIKVINIL